MTAGDGAFTASGVDAAAIGELAAANGIVLHELSPKQASLEEAFLEVTRESQQYSGGTLPGGAP